MPGTHLLPPNLLKLFAPRPPLAYTRPLDRDIDRVRSKAVAGVAAVLARLADAQVDAGAAPAVPAAGDAPAPAPDMEEGEEPTFTLAEEVKREIRREERKKARADKFKLMKETCACAWRARPWCAADDAHAQTSPRTTPRPSATPTKRSLSRVS
jgi:U1 small nuclear ribonucleoprotein